MEWKSKQIRQNCDAISKYFQNNFKKIEHITNLENGDDLVYEGCKKANVLLQHLSGDETKNLVSSLNIQNVDTTVDQLITIENLWKRKSLKD